MASASVTGAPSNRPYVDRKLSAMLSGTFAGRRWDSWYVYLVFDRNQLLRYAGQTGALFSRFSQHRTAGRLGNPARHQGDDWADVMAIGCRNEIQVKAFERKLIHGFHPPDNKKCELPGCRHYLDGGEFYAASRGAVNKFLRGRGIEVR